MPPTLAAVVRERTGATWSRARRLCEEGRVRVDGVRVLDPAARVPQGAEVAIDAQGPRRDTGRLAKEALVFHDRDLVVVDKPPGLLSVADEAGNRDTAMDHARTALRRAGADDTALGVVHRLDRETSGLMVFTRSALAKRALAAAFRAHDIERVYLAIVNGVLEDEKVIESDLVLDRGDGLRGSHGRFRRSTAPPPREARHAITRVRPLEALRDATLVECRLETGRQHQIRIHLSELGHPLAGESVYIRDFKGKPLEAARAMLHARTLGFTHPRTAAAMSWTREPPEDFARILEALR